MEKQLLNIISGVDINDAESLRRMVYDIINRNFTYDVGPIEYEHSVAYDYYPYFIYHTKRLIIIIVRYNIELRQIVIVCNNRCICIDITQYKYYDWPRGFYLDETIDETINTLFDRYSDENKYAIINYFRDYKPKCEHEPNIDWLMAGLNSTKSAKNI